MTLFKKKVNSKMVIMFLLQLVAMAFVFVLLADRQTIFIIKDFVHSLNLDANTHTLLSRMYVGIKMMFDLPSMFGICVFLIQLVCATWTFEVMLFNNCPKKVNVETEKIDNPKQIVESITFAKNYSYLENLRLLN